MNVAWTWMVTVEERNIFVKWNYWIYWWTRCGEKKQGQLQIFWFQQWGRHCLKEIRMVNKWWHRFGEKIWEISFGYVESQMSVRHLNESGLSFLNWKYWYKYVFKSWDWWYYQENEYKWTEENQRHFGAA